MWGGEDGSVLIVIVIIEIIIHLKKDIPVPSESCEDRLEII